MTVSVNNSEYDAIVIGMGPAGANASFHLAKSGMKVLAFEQRSLPRSKLCAGGIPAKAFHLLDFDFSSAIEREISGAYVRFKDGRSIDSPNQDKAGYIVNRAAYDYLLAERAKSCGVEIHDNETVLELSENGGHVRVSTGKSDYSCRYLIGADGVNGITAKYLGHRHKSAILGAEVHVPDSYPIIAENQDRLGFYFGDIPKGYGWIFPRKHNASIGIGIDSKYAGDARLYLKKFLSKLNIPEFYAEKAKGHFIPVYSPFSSAHYARKKILLTGDAASLVDPITGEGIYYALKTGEYAAYSVKNAGQGNTAADIYKSIVEGGIARELRAAWKIAKPLYALPNLASRLFSSHRWILEMYFDVILGKASYVDLIQMLKGTFRIPFFGTGPSIRKSN